MKQARQVRDTNDTLSLINYLRERPICRESISLQHCQWHDCQGRGQCGTCMEKISLIYHLTVKVKGESVRVDPLLIFQRLVTISEHSVDDLMSLFQNELLIN